MQISPKYNHIEIEKKWYSYWMKNELFKSIPNDKEPFTIVIPPPNVTGLLHMGHMLNNTLQDILVRRARMLGKNACWVPGTCLLYTSPSPRDTRRSRMPSSA